MNNNHLSSPAARQTSLPPSSAPLPSSLSTNGHSQTPRRNRQPIDALAFGDEDQDDDDAAEDVAARKRARPRGQNGLETDIPIVKDAVGESVRESFETFLKTWVLS